jgi:hypothetical protein
MSNLRKNYNQTQKQKLTKKIVDPPMKRKPQEGKSDVRRKIMTGSQRRYEGEKLNFKRKEKQQTINYSLQFIMSVR